MGETVLTLAEFMTLTTQVEDMLNSRPNTPLSSDPTNFTALTPGHFLIGTALAAIQEADLQTTALSIGISCKPSSNEYGSRSIYIRFSNGASGPAQPLMYKLESWR